jgi:hypothetical protein
MIYDNSGGGIGATLTGVMEFVEERSLTFIDVM